jgi:tetratricopeptide (TPR) repeat protein
MKTIEKYFAMFLLLGVSVVAAAQAPDAMTASEAIAVLQQEWAHTNYEQAGDAQTAAFENLVLKAQSYVQKFPDDAGVWTWSGIVKSSYAGAKGGLGALKLAKQAKSDLEKALSIDDQALSGSAYTSLGTLYYKVPGWPAGFGSNKKAEALLKQALAINPHGIDSNYFYGDYLIERKNYAEAERYLRTAMAAKPRADRPIADMGRHKEIDAALAIVIDKLGVTSQANLGTQ